MTESIRQSILSHLTTLTSQSLRCLGFASKVMVDDLKDYNGISHSAHKYIILHSSYYNRRLTDVSQYEAIESDLVFYGLVGIKDPARMEVSDSIEQCRQAGIRVFMITGDNKNTAEAIARDVGIIAPGEEKETSFEANEFMQLSHDEQLRVLSGNGGRVFSRSEPIHKKQLIALLKQMGEITAMTGDGVNDAPALQQADIGVAMGISGTEVATEASDMVLVDDNFSTIVAAIEEGRSIYQNMKAFIRYLISSNIGEVASIFFTAMLGIPEGLSPVQLLWVNLVTDGPPATALGFNPPEPDIMNKPPRDKDEGLITPFVFFRYVIIGLYVGFATVGIFVYWYVFDKGATDDHPLVTMHQLMNHSKCPSWTDFSLHGYGSSFHTPCDYFEDKGKVIASTLSLTVLVTIEMFNALNALSEECSLLVVPPHKNMYLVAAIVASFIAHFCILYIHPLASIFSVSPLTWREWKLVLWFSFPVIVIDEVLKLVGRLMDKKQRQNHVAEAVPLLSIQ